MQVFNFYPEPLWTKKKKRVRISKRRLKPLRSTALKKEIKYMKS